MTLATPVTTSIISMLRASRRTPKSTWNWPTASQVETDSRVVCQPFADTKMMLRIKPAMTAAMDRPALSLRSCLVKSVISAVASSGRNRIIQGRTASVIGSEFQQGQVFHVSGAALAIKGDDQGQPHGDLGRGDRDNEEDKD